MAKRNNVEPYYITNDQNKKETIEEVMKRKKAKEREEKIRQKKQEERKEEFDLETETVIQMTNRNNLKKEQIRKKQQDKEARKKAKRRKKIKFFLKLFLLIALIAGGTTFALTSPIFNIKDIKVLNNNKIATEMVVSLSRLKTEENIFKFSKINAEKAIKEEPYIESVEIHRKLPNTVEIEVVERVAKFSVDYMGKYAYINSQGYILEIAEESQNLPVIQGASTNEQDFQPGNRLNTEDLEKLGTIIQIMDACKESGLDGEVTSIDISDKNEYSIYLGEEKKRIYLGDASNLSNKMLYVQAIIEKNKDVEGEIFVNGDLNNGFNPYFREKV